MVKNCSAETKKAHTLRVWALEKEPATTYFRTFRHYHQLQLLDGRVRDGNEYCQLDMVTGNHRPMVFHIGKCQ